MDFPNKMMIKKHIHLFVKEMKIVNLNYLIIILLIIWNTCYPQEKLHTYGFFDFEASVNNKDAAGKIWTFDQHHLNILANYRLDNRFRVATEIEWEHGPVHGEGDFIGNIYLAKAFLEYKYSDALLVRIGKFLSPFGIYNERHDATPTFLFTVLPKSVYGTSEIGKGRSFAAYATGIQLLGNLFANDWEARYQVYLSNGRGPNDSEKDNNSNKGVGWRFVVSPPIGDLHIGTSFYTDLNGDADNARQTTLGFDVQYDLSAAHVEAEIIYPKLENVDTSGNPTGDFTYPNGYYILGAYTLFNRLTPFVRYDFFDPDIDVINNGEKIIVIGLNYAVSPRIYLKAAVHFHRFQDPSIESYEMFISSVAVAF